MHIILVAGQCSGQRGLLHWCFTLTQMAQAVACHVFRQNETKHNKVFVHLETGSCTDTGMICILYYGIIPVN